MQGRREEQGQTMVRIPGSHEETVGGGGRGKPGDLSGGFEVFKEVLVSRD